MWPRLRGEMCDFLEAKRENERKRDRLLKEFIFHSLRAQTERERVVFGAAKVS